MLAPGTDSPLDDGQSEPDDAASDDPLETFRGALDGIDALLTGTHDALKGVSAMLAALEQGQTLPASQYQEKQRQVLGLVTMLDGSLTEVRTMKHAISEESDSGGGA